MARKDALRQLVQKQKARVRNQLDRRDVVHQDTDTNFILITLDSCRYDAFCDANTPNLDAFGPWLPAQSPASYTYAAHQSFFVGIIPCVSEPVPYYNRFTRQLIGLVTVGEHPGKKSTYYIVMSDDNIVDGLARAGFQTVGTGAMNWFRQSSLISAFDKFQMHIDAEDQIAFVLKEIDPARPFFAFMNFGETHDPFHYRGKEDPCPVRVQARLMTWPPAQTGPVGRDHVAYKHQIESIEFLDRQLGHLLAKLPSNTIAVVCGDHGECLGEDGYWGHGINHPRVFEVPLGIFRLDGEPIEADSEIPTRLAASPSNDAINQD